MNDNTSELHSYSGDIAAAYTRIVDRWNREWDSRQDNERRNTLRHLFLDSLPGTRVLDCGCGLGRDSVYFAEKGCRVIAADIVPDFLPIVKAGHPAIAPLVMDMTRPCFAEGVFDGVYLYASFIHVPPERTLSTLAGFRRMLTAGGVLFIQHVASRRGLDSYRVEELLIPDNPITCFCHDEMVMGSLLTAAGFGSRTFHALPLGMQRSKASSAYALDAYQVVAKNDALITP